MKNLQANADRFVGFADIYDEARPQCPEKVKDILTKYLDKKPDFVVDLGCGTGLSTILWANESDRVLGIEPSEDMIRLAKSKADKLPNVTFKQGFSDNTELQDMSADIVTCSQSFHWMNPDTTLKEVSRILKPGGIFAAYDCDWPPVCNWEAEMEYIRLFDKVLEIEKNHPDIKDTFVKWDKDKHLDNIINCKRFRYVREIVFSNSENCNAKRFISIALSQGGLQTILKTESQVISSYIEEFQNKIINIFGEGNFEIDFCYRIRLGVK